MKDENENVFLDNEVNLSENINSSNELEESDLFDILMGRCPPSSSSSFSGGW